MNVSSQRPRLSVLMPTYNRAVFLERAIRSALSQTLQDFELIVIDDHSTDETPEILRKWQEKEPRLRWVRNEKNLGQNFGFPKVLNRGLSLAKGKYIARLDDDDIWIEPEKLARQVAFLESHPDHVVVGTGMLVVDDAGKELYRVIPAKDDKEIRAQALLVNPVAHPTAVYRRDAALKVGLYDESIPFAEDWDLWLRLGKIGKLANIPECWTRFRFTGENQSFRFQKRQALVTLRIIWRHRKAYPRFPAALTLNTLRIGYVLIPTSVRKIIQPSLQAAKRFFFSHQD